MYTYSAVQWLLIFYSYCFLGWCFETTVVSAQQKHFVNRGFVRGPMLPLYGTGAVLLLFVALPLQKQPVVLFFAGMVAATTLEYCVGWAMESIFKVKYWDYSSHRFQYKGRICLQSSIAWGVLTLLLVHFIHPPIADVLALLPPLAGGVLATAISVVFAADVGYAVRTALDLARVLEELTRLRAQMEETRAQIALAAEETREKLSTVAEETREKLSSVAEETREKLSSAADDTREKLSAAAQNTRERLSEAAAGTRDKLQGALDELQSAYEKRMEGVRGAGRQLLRGNPSAVSARFSDALRELKEHINYKK